MGIRGIRTVFLGMALLSCSRLLAETVQTQVVFSPLSNKHPVNVTETGCLKKKQTNTGMMDCASFAIKNWDQEVNRLYDALMATLKPEFQQELKESQNAWLKYRDKEFVFYDNYIGREQGSIWPYVSLTFKRDFIKNRAEILYRSANAKDLSAKAEE